MHPLKHLLMEKISPDGSPLFRSGLALAHVIASIELLGDTIPNRYFGKKQSVASYVNQAFRDNRSLPKNLVTAILYAASERLSGAEPPVRERWLVSIEYSLDGKPQDSEAFEELAELADCARDSTSMCAVFTGASLLDRTAFLRPLLLAALEAVDGNWSKLPLSCLLIVPTQDGGEQLWQQIRAIMAEPNHGVERGFRGPSRTTVQDLPPYSGMIANIEVRVVAPHFALLPIVAFNVHHPATRKGYLLTSSVQCSTDNPGALNIYSLSTQDLQWWVNSFYIRLKNGSIPGEQLVCDRVECIGTHS